MILPFLWQMRPKKGFWRRNVDSKRFGIVKMVAPTSNLESIELKARTHRHCCHTGQYIFRSLHVEAESLFCHHCRGNNIHIGDLRENNLNFGVARAAFKADAPYPKNASFFIHCVLRFFVSHSFSFLCAILNCGMVLPESTFDFYIT